MAHTLSRKEFLALTVAAGAALVAEACGDDTGSGGAGATGTSSGTPTTTSGSPTSTTVTGSGTSVSGSSSTHAASSGAGNLCSTDVVAEISCPHAQPHELTVPIADITAGTDKTYDIKGQANHSHMVTITAADFATLASGGTVYKFVEAGNNQDHCVTISCGTPGDPQTSGQCDGGNAFDCN